MRTPIIPVIGLSLCILASPAAAGEPEAPEIVRLLPTGTVTAGIFSDGQPEHYVGKKLFDYMNGGAELYLAYGFEDLGVAEYKQADLQLRVALYKMGSAPEAYGIYTHAARGRRVDLPGPNRLEPNMLSFYKGRFYVRVLPIKAGPDADRAMIALGRHIWKALPGKPEVPAAVASLPKGFVAGTLRYLTHPETARTIWFNGEGKPLLPDGASAVTAIYGGDEDDIQLTRAEYPDQKAAVLACRKLAERLKLTPTSDDEKCAATGKTPDEVFASLATQGNVLRWASGPGNDKQAQKQLARIE